jgi:hypothetical protein
VQFFPGTLVVVHSVLEDKLQQFNSSHHPLVLQESFFHLHPFTVVHVDWVLSQQTAADTEKLTTAIKIVKLSRNKTLFLII